MAAIDEKALKKCSVRAGFDDYINLLEQKSQLDYSALLFEAVDVIFREIPVTESDEDKPGVILDYDAAGDLVSIEVLDASRRVDEPRFRRPCALLL